MGWSRRHASNRATPRVDLDEMTTPYPLRTRTVHVSSFLLATFAVLGLTSLPGRLAAQAIRGQVRDSAGAPIATARVAVVELSRTTTTDTAGRFTITAVPAGQYTLLVRKDGYAPSTQMLRTTGIDTTVAVVLSPSAFQLEPVTVTATRSPSLEMTSPLPASALTSVQLRRNESVSLAHAISSLAGVRTLSTGAQIGKPVIRGLSGPRVLVLSDGSRLEDYSWSDEDGPSIDARLADRVEVIRGPASVLYGSDALGGVVNVIPAPVPDANGGAGFVHTGYEAYGATNNAEFGGILRAEGATGEVGWRVVGIGRHAASLHTPNGELDNTGYFALNGEAAVGVHGRRGDFNLRYARYGGEFKLLEAGGPPPGVTAGQDQGPERRLGDDRVQATGNYVTGPVRFEAHAQWERHSLIEVSDDSSLAAGGPPVESTSFDLLLNTLSLDLLAHHAPIGPLKGTIGVSGMHEINDTRGPIPLVPDARVNAGALFVLEQASTGPVTLLAGGRVDVRRLNADANTTLALAAQQRDYTAYSGDVGVVVRPLPALAFAANVGRAWRAPTLFELFSNGPQLGEARYDLGDPTLVPELGTSIDASIRWETGRVRGSLAGYTNLVNHFIYITPTAQFRDSLRVYDYVQASARLIGAEASLEVEATRMLAFHATADAVRGTNRDTDVPLPLMPPPRLTVGAEVHSGADPAAARVGASVQMVARQTRLNPMDVPTNGYALLALSAGLTHRLGGRDFHFDLDVHNALNTKYTSFLSRYKEFALNPGRNIIFRISTAD